MSLVTELVDEDFKLLNDHLACSQTLRLLKRERSCLLLTHLPSKPVYLQLFNDAIENEQNEASSTKERLLQRGIRLVEILDTDDGVIETYIKNGKKFNQSQTEHSAREFLVVQLKRYLGDDLVVHVEE